MVGMINFQLQRELTLIYFGKSVSFSNNRSHEPCVKNGIIGTYKSNKFTEYLNEIDPNTYITNEGESLFSFGEVKETIKKEIIYVKN